MPVPAPALTPSQKALKRVLFISLLDSWSVIIVAGLSLLGTLIFFELLGVGISGLILAGGIMEMRGRRALQRRRADGMNLLVRSQFFMLAVILVYSARCLGSFDAGYLSDQIPELRQNFSAFGLNFDEILQQSGLSPSDLVPLAHKAFFLLYGTLAFVSLVFQGGLALYYKRKTALVTEALSTPPAV